MKHQQMLFVLALTLGLLLVACGDPKPPVGTPAGDTGATATTSADTVGLPTFEGRNAYKHIETQVSFGPRNPNSAGSKKALAFFVEELSKYADNVTKQEFTHQGYDGEALNLTNVVASFNPAQGKRILLCAHWDTRPRAEEDNDEARRNEPILGANDAGSGVGILLELARIMKEHPPAIGVDIVLFDGEDYGRPSDLDNYFLGSRYFVENLPNGYTPSFGILLDIVGDADAQFPKEGYSMEYAPEVVNVLWGAAQKLGLKHFVQRQGPAISDDHLILNEGDLKAINIIDASLVGNEDPSPRRRYWHTHNDTLDNISTETLNSVGTLLTYVLYKLAPQAAGMPA